MLPGRDVACNFPFGYSKAIVLKLPNVNRFSALSCAAPVSRVDQRIAAGNATACFHAHPSLPRWQRICFRLGV
ncbi:hypothetical protein BCAR13_520092 [Paraburkholderia caribensis]|nr:hypothetical protein BCAR13_520092 [Paraburkholderia caribensis]